MVWYVSKYGVLIIIIMLNLKINYVQNYHPYTKQYLWNVKESKKFENEKKKRKDIYMYIPYYLRLKSKDGMA